MKKNSTKNIYKGKFVGTRSFSQEIFTLLAPCFSCSMPLLALGGTARHFVARCRSSSSSVKDTPPCVLTNATRHHQSITHLQSARARHAHDHGFLPRSTAHLTARKTREHATIPLSSSRRPVLHTCQQHHSHALSSHSNRHRRRALREAVMRFATGPYAPGTSLSSSLPLRLRQHCAGLRS